MTCVLAQHWAVPPIVPADAPLADGFSADRTRDVLHDLAACGPKYVGAEGNEVCAVEAVLKQIAKSSKGRESRLTLETQSASGHFYLDFIGGFTVAYRNLTNLVARVRGQRPGCALLISSHFDSAIGSVATSDANAEIAIMTDLLRLFLHDPPDVDVIFNFNGGEEFIMPAAHGFVTSHPWAPEICAQVNLEAAGSGGRELLFQALANSGRLSHCKMPLVAFGFMTGIVPGETDYRVYRDFGNIPGADFAVLTNGWIYHTWRDDIAHLDFRSVQRYGDTINEFARGLAKKLRNGRPTGSDVTDSAVFFDIGGVFFVEYSADLARKLHVAAAIVVLSSLLLRRGVAAYGVILKAAAKLFMAFLSSLLAAAITGLLVAFTPAALAGSGHPELAPLLFVPPALAAFLGCLKLLGRDEDIVEEGSIALGALLCLGLSLSSVAVLASYPFLLWSALPALAAFCPRPMRAVSTTAAFVLPWLLHLQFLVLALDLLCPLTFRSGTSVPGDVVIGATFGLMTGLFLALSARFILPIPHWATKMLCLITFVMAFGLAFWIFPYSFDRPKRIIYQHTARSQVTWSMEADGTAKAHWEPMESGIWTASQDWNNVDTMRKFAPYGLPSGSKWHNNSMGLYGQVPFPFPLKWLTLGGAWAQRPPPEIPVPIAVQLSSLPNTDAGGESLRSVDISVSGPPNMMLVLGPLSSIKAWSFGRYATVADAADLQLAVDMGQLPKQLPFKRMDCDCMFLLFAEGGRSPSNGRAEAFNFTVSASLGELDMDIWSLNLEKSSPELKHEEERTPSWVNFYGWTAELQVHRMLL
ncbi:Ermp1 [Symbiodinium pilosum]|uniref:Ermp1 protein n=1 Tax=Symbiodinium pilosum TaxID=2952 RepID=A0A812JFH3_SYMPI|nr:Ermp1 [Symbiodinium pilosum]